MTTVNNNPDSRAYKTWTGPAWRSASFVPPAAVWLTSDWHIGARTCDMAKLEKHADYARELRASAIHLGDALESVTNGVGGVGAMGGIFEQFNPPSGQMPLNFQKAEFMRLLEGIPLLAATEGNHGHRTARMGLDLDADMYQLLGAEYLGVLGVVELGITRMLVSHGEGGGQNHFKLRRRDFPGYDVYAGGHTHQLYADVHAEGFESKPVYTIRTGHYLGMAQYGLRQQMSGAAGPTGSVMLHLKGDGTIKGLDILT